MGLYPVAGYLNWTTFNVEYLNSDHDSAGQYLLQVKRVDTIPQYSSDIGLFTSGSSGRREDRIPRTLLHRVFSWQSWLYLSFRLLNNTIVDICDLVTVNVREWNDLFSLL
nr:uncharacterized protein LOC109622578 [Aedes albopictus]